MQRKAKAEKIVDFTPKEISNITPEEIQRLLYDQQVYQIELQMQNDELEKTQLEMSQINNRLNLSYHQVPVGILTLDYQGFIEQVNHTFTEMVNLDGSHLIKKHFSKLIVEQDKTIFMQRYDAFFKSPKNKNIQLRLEGENNSDFSILIQDRAMMDQI